MTKTTIRHRNLEKKITKKLPKHEREKARTTNDRLQEPYKCELSSQADQTAKMTNISCYKKDQNIFFGFSKFCDFNFLSDIFWRLTGKIFDFLSLVSFLADQISLRLLRTLEDLRTDPNLNKIL